MLSNVTIAMTRARSEVLTSFLETRLDYESIKPSKQTYSIFSKILRPKYPLIDPNSLVTTGLVAFAEMFEIVKL